MKLLIILSLFISTLFFISCKTPGGVSASEKIGLDTWVGKSRTELLQTWGRATETKPDGSGGEMLIYDTTIIYPQTPGVVYKNGNRGLDNGADNYAVTKTRIFYINPQAIVYRWEAKERQGY